MGLDQKIGGYDEYGQEVEIKYYRKENWLRNWVIENTTLTHSSNTESVKLTREQVEELLKTCEYVLNNKDKAPEKLETLEGFFFGGYEYDQWYFEGVEQVRDDLKEMLNDDEIKYFDYWDWW